MQTAGITQEQEKVSFDQVKKEITDLLKNDAFFRKETFKDFDFQNFTEAKILFREYYDYSDEKCLIISVVVPDKVLPLNDRKEITSFMKDKGKPIIKSIAELDSVKEISLDYYIVDIFLTAESDLTHQ